MKEAERLRHVEPSVAAASMDELITAGWGNIERCRIPANWREGHVPGEVVPREPWNAARPKQHESVEQHAEKMRARKKLR